MESVLVTGATGFIGSRLVKRLVEKDYKVSTLVRKGRHAGIKTDEIIGDLTETLNFDGKSFDCVFHLASHNPLEKRTKVLEKVNLDGAKNLFKAVKDKTKSLVYISGLGVYGDPVGRTIDESYPYSPDTNFAKTRLDAQKFLEDMCKENKISFAVIHLGDVYGSGGWFYEMIVKRLQKKSFRLPGGGKYYKGFVHVDDAVGSMIAVMENKVFEESYIIADSTPVTFVDFVNYTADAIGAKHPGNVPIFLAKAALGSDLIKLLTTSMKVSNQKISKIYKFKYPSYKDGVTAVIKELKDTNML